MRLPPPSSYWFDIDGTVLRHKKTNSGILLDKDNPEGELLPGVRDELDRLHAKGCKIFFVTARPECMRDFTVKQLLHHGLAYDGLVMGVGCGVRVMVNDRKPYYDGDTAFGITVPRDGGLAGLLPD